MKSRPRERKKLLPKAPELIMWKSRDLNPGLDLASLVCALVTLH